MDRNVTYGDLFNEPLRIKIIIFNALNKRYFKSISIIRFTFEMAFKRQ